MCSTRRNFDLIARRVPDTAPLLRGMPSQYRGDFPLDEALHEALFPQVDADCIADRLRNGCGCGVCAGSSNVCSLDDFRTSNQQPEYEHSGHDDARHGKSSKWQSRRSGNPGQRAESYVSQSSDSGHAEHGAGLARRATLLIRPLLRRPIQRPTPTPTMVTRTVRGIPMGLRGAA